jgi:hypothetical protein
MDNSEGDQMTNFATQTVRFCEASDLNSVTADLLVVADGLAASWPKPLVTQHIVIVPVRGEPRTFQRQPINAVLPVIRESLARNFLHHLAWEVSDGQDSQQWRITLHLGAAARVSLQVDELHMTPPRQLRRQQDAAVHRLVDAATTHIAATSKQVYGRPLMIYCYCVVAELLQSRSRNEQKPIKTIFSQLPSLLKSTALRLEAEPRVAVSAGQLSQWMVNYEKQIGSNVRDSFREYAA